VRVGLALLASILSCNQCLHKRINRPLLKHIVNIGRWVEKVAYQRMCMIIAICGSQ